MVQTLQVFQILRLVLVVQLALWVQMIRLRRADLARQLVLSHLEVQLVQTDLYEVEGMILDQHS
jgi:hypothetical protein